MNLKLAQSISRLSLMIIFGVVLLLALAIGIGTLGLGLNLNPFTSRVSGLLGALFMGLIGIACVSLLLNIATNLSIIADRDSGIFKNASGKQVELGRILKIFTSILVVASAFMIGGTLYSRQKYKSFISKQAQEIIQTNQDLMKKIGVSLSTRRPEDFDSIADTLKYLTRQRRDFPGVLLIYGAKFQDKSALYQIGPWSGSVTVNNVKKFDGDYYTCAKETDCEYLNKFFAGEIQENLDVVKSRSDEYFIYRPIVEGESRFVLLFSKVENYGKFGSRDSL
jgi:hypothetical protein